MFELENVEFIGFGSVLVELEDDRQVECETTLKTYADYREWVEDMHPDGIGYWETFSENNLDENDVENIEILSPSEYFIDDKEFNTPKIKKLIKCINVNWEVQI